MTLSHPKFQSIRCTPKSSFIFSAPEKGASERCDIIASLFANRCHVNILAFIPYYTIRGIHAHCPARLMLDQSHEMSHAHSHFVPCSVLDGNHSMHSECNLLRNTIEWIKTTAILRLLPFITINFYPQEPYFLVSDYHCLIILNGCFIASSQSATSYLLTTSSAKISSSVIHSPRPFPIFPSSTLSMTSKTASVLIPVYLNYFFSSQSLQLDVLIAIHWLPVQNLFLKMHTKTR